MKVFFFGLGYCARRLIQRERWIEASGANDTLGRAIEGGNADALAKALKSGKVRVKPK